MNGGVPQALRLSANESEHRATGVTDEPLRSEVAEHVESLRVRADLLDVEQCGTCGWRHTPGGRCPSPARQLCGSCDAGLPMSCTCVDQPEVAA